MYIIVCYNLSAKLLDAHILYRNKLPLISILFIDNALHLKIKSVAANNFITEINIENRAHTHIHFEGT